MAKIKLKIEKEYDVQALHVDAGVRYWENGTVNGIEDENGDLIPCREGDRWRPIIDVESGKIINWTAGTKSELHYKVCDDGIYTLKDVTGEVIISIDGYVPTSLCPKDNGYGDYIIMDIDENGFIQNWKFKVSDFEQED